MLCAGIFGSLPLVLIPSKGKDDFFMNKDKKIYILAECAVMVALATGLSMIKVIKMPFGGSVTLLSMLPIMIFGLRRGAPWSLACSAVYSLVQLVLDLGEIFTWGLTPQALVACGILDYFLAFSVLGFVGFFAKKGLPAAMAGISLSILLRLAVHVISGVVLWHSSGALWSGFPADNELLYSLVYNGVYMVPEMIFTLVGAAALIKVPQTRKILSLA